MNTTNTNFSVLMSVYTKDNPDYLLQALNSLTEQTLKPKELVLVIDGPIPLTLQTVIEQWTETQIFQIKQVKLEKNQGLGLALAQGLEQCSYQLIARMDSDDICLNNRFERQYAYMQKHPEISVLGGFIAEFETSPDEIQSLRKVPLTQAQITSAAKYMSPMNHVAVMFKKDAVLAAGNYQHCLFFEDYDLWVRMLMQGAQMANLDDVLVYVRTGAHMLRRRRGWFMLKQWFSFIRRLRAEKFISRSYALYLMIARTVVCFLPLSLLKLAYRYIRRCRDFSAADRLNMRKL